MTVVEDIKELVKCSDFRACRDSNEARIRNLVTKDEILIEELPNGKIAIKDNGNDLVYRAIYILWI